MDATVAVFLTRLGSTVLSPVGNTIIIQCFRAIGWAGIQEGQWQGDSLPPINFSLLENLL